MTTNKRVTNTIHYILVFPLLALVFFIYTQGSTGSFYYDDIRPLSALTKVTDLNSALVYVFSESSGMLGRSITMLTFLLNVNDWPSGKSIGDPSHFFIINILIHVFNGLLIFGLSHFIAYLYRGEHKTNFWLALGSAFFWLILPMHVSTTLIAIQRMAGLSALFVFAGLLIYVYGLYKQVLFSQDFPLEKNNKGLSLQLIGIVLFTLLAMFSKENGALLPLFILVLEITLFSKVIGIEHRRRIRVTACFLGLLLMLTFMGYSVISAGNSLAGREFTLLERLMTQPQILLDYLRLAYFPDVAAYNPFHDNYPYITHILNSPKAVASLLTLLITFCTAILFRRRFPLYSFSVLWFLTAHLLESSVISLELYFEHRNYVALFGPCLAIVFSLTKVSEKMKTIVVTSFALYLAILTFNLALTTSLWGDKEQAANTWFIEQKGSPRASEHLAYYYLKQNKLDTAWQVLEQQTKYCPECINSNIQAMLLSCILKKEQAMNSHYNQALHLANTNSKIYKAPSGLEMVFTNIINKQCSLLTIDQLKPINIAIEQKANLNKHEKRQIFLNLYKIYAMESNHQQAIYYLKLAWQVNNSHLVAKYLIEQLLMDNQHQAALEFSRIEMCLNLPNNTFLIKAALLRCHQAELEIMQTIKAL